MKINLVSHQRHIAVMNSTAVTNKRWFLIKWRVQKPLGLHYVWIYGHWDNINLAVSLGCSLETLGMN